MKQTIQFKFINMYCTLNNLPLFFSKSSPNHFFVIYPKIHYHLKWTGSIVEFVSGSSKSVTHQAVVDPDRFFAVVSQAFYATHMNKSATVSSVLYK